MTENKNEKATEVKAFHMEFTFSNKTPGAITLTGADENEVIEKLQKMMSSFDSVDIVRVVDYATIPELIAIREHQEKQRAENFIGDIPADEDAAPGNDDEEETTNTIN